MTPVEREISRLIEKGVSSSEKSFSVPKLDFRRTGDLFTMLKLDNPLLFNVDTLSFSCTDLSSSMTVKPKYTMKKQEYETTLQTVGKRLRKILAPSENMSCEEKERFIHDYIVQNVRYDKLEKSYSHEVTGPLCHGIGVCEGMSKVFKLMCDASGIESLVAVGTGMPPGEGSGRKSERHAWNVVFLANTPYGVDVTFDATSANGSIRYDYFNIPDSIMMRDHSDIAFAIPKCCDGSKEHYSCEGLLFDSADDILPALKKAASAPFSCQFRLKNETEIGELCTAAKKLMAEDKRFRRFSSFSFTLNSVSRVASVSFERRAADNGGTE